MPETADSNSEQTRLSGQFLSQLCNLAGLDPALLARVRLTGSGPILPSSFNVDALAQAAIAAAGLAAAELDRLRSGRLQTVTVDRRHAAAEFRSERYLRINGKPAPDPWDKIAGAYQTGDGRWMRLHTNFAHHRDGVLAILACSNDRAAVAKALLNWEAEAFETEASNRGLVVAMMRSFKEWDAHPQGKAVAALPGFTITRIGDSPPRRHNPALRPLQGIRVLDLTRIIAGPVAGRALAAHGADVLHVTSPSLPAILPLVIDTGRGKRTTALNLDSKPERRQLKSLAEQADVFLQGYRPGGLAARGFGPDELAKLNPGIIAASLSAYGPAGPWAGKRGFDSLVQTAIGFNHAEAEAAGSSAPKPLPCQALDHASGYLLAITDTSKAGSKNRAALGFILKLSV